MKRLHKLGVPVPRRGKARSHNISRIIDPSFDKSSRDKGHPGESSILKRAANTCRHLFKSNSLSTRPPRPGKPGENPRAFPGTSLLYCGRVCLPVRNPGKILRFRPNLWRQYRNFKRTHHSWRLDLEVVAEGHFRFDSV